MPEGPPPEPEEYEMGAPADVDVEELGASYGWSDLDSIDAGEPVAEVPAEKPGQFQPGGGVPEEIYEGLNPAQRQAVEILDGPVLIIAGAGSGKTRVLTRRIAAHITSGVDPAQILAITFTNKAAAEMRLRVGELVGTRALDQMWVSTFHSACVRMLRMKGPLRWFSIVDAGDSQKILRGVLEDLGYSKDDLGGGFVRKVAGYISRSKNHLTPPKGDNTGGVADAAAEAYAAYQAQLRSMKAYDFDDLLVETVRLLKTDEEALTYFSDKFRYILIDEYQDTNRAQYAICALLAAKHRNLCVVGDPGQSIYLFRGANVENILAFENQWPGASVVELTQNYRSTKTILEAANVVRSSMKHGGRTALWTEGADGEAVQLYVGDDDRDEASFVVRRVRETGVPGDHAVLYRTNAQSRPLEDALMASSIPYRIVGGTRFYDRAEIKDAVAYLRFCVNPTDIMAFNRVHNTPRRGIGAKTAAAILEVAEEREIDLLEAARVCTDPDVGGRGAASVRKFVAFCDKVSEAAETEGPAAALEVVLVGVDGSRAQFHRMIDAGTPPEKALRDSMGQTGQGAMYSKYGDDKEAERLQNLFELGRAAAEFCDGPIPATMPEAGGVAELTPRQQTEAYLEHVALVSDLDSLETGSEDVLLMTMHAAKGLEFPHVTVVGLEDGLLPLRFGRSWQSPEELAEERRLCYVALTRAEETLCLTRAKRRFMYGNIVEHPESEFLTEIRNSVDLVAAEGSSGVGYGAARSSGGRYEWRGSGRKTSNTGGGRGPDQPYRQGQPSRQRQGRYNSQYGGQRSSSQRPANVSGGTASSDGREKKQSSDWKFSDPVPAAGRAYESEIPEGLKPSAVVTHPKFGRGVVLSMEGAGDDTQVTVRFEDVGSKTLLAKYAKLEVAGH